MTSMWLLWLACGMPAEEAAPLGVAQPRIDLLDARLSSVRPKTGHVPAEVLALRARRQERRAQLQNLRQQHNGTLETTRKVRRAVDVGITVKELLADREALRHLGGARRHHGPDGRPDGYQLSAIYPGSTLELLGLENGDVVQAVAGMRVVHPKGVEAAWTRLQELERFGVDVDRDGEEVWLVIDTRTVLPDPPD